MKNRTFRRAQVEDAENLVRLVNSAYRGESSKVGWTTEADLLDGQRLDIEGAIQSIQENILLLAEDESGELKGCVQLMPKNAQRYYLGMLTVKPNLQGEGIGAQLLKACEQQVAELGGTSIEMTVISLRHELIEWYRKKGYQPTGERRPFPYGNERFGLPRRADLEFQVLEKKFTSGELK